MRLESIIDDCEGIRKDLEWVQGSEDLETYEEYVDDAVSELDDLQTSLRTLSDKLHDLL